MPDVKQFKLPDVGEGLTEADILSWSVDVGDVVTVNQTLVEVETAKAAVELPSPFAGTVTALHAEVGATVEVGTPIISIDTGDGSASAVAAAPPAGEPTTESTGAASTGAASTGAASTGPAAAASDSGRQAVLVGYGPRTGPVTRRARRSSVAADGGVAVPSVQGVFSVAPTAADPVPASAESRADAEQFAAGDVASAVVPVDTGSLGGEARPAGTAVLAKPPVRKLARQLGVDLSALTPTGPNGSVSREDVQKAADGTATPPAPQTTVPTFDASAREQRIPIRGVRKHTAAAMVSSAFTAPHVTEFVTIDITPTMQLRERIAARRDFRDVKVSPLLLVARALLWAVRRTPIVNATWDEAAGEIVLKSYVNLGIAAATERGLMVPNVKDADALSLRELAGALTTLTETARAGRTAPAALTGGTITITNVGVFGVDTGTPILNPGEAAILAFGAVRRQPWVVNRDGVEAIEPRWVTQLALSFDHRLVDGEQGSIFLADLAAVLADPGLALL